MLGHAGLLPPQHPAEWTPVPPRAIHFSRNRSRSFISGFATTVSAARSMGACPYRIQKDVVRSSAQAVFSS